LGFDKRPHAFLSRFHGLLKAPSASEGLGFVDHGRPRTAATIQPLARARGFL